MKKLVLKGLGDFQQETLGIALGELGDGLVFDSQPADEQEPPDGVNCWAGRRRGGKLKCIFGPLAGVTQDDKKRAKSMGVGGSYIPRTQIQERKQS